MDSTSVQQENAVNLQPESRNDPVAAAGQLSDRTLQENIRISTELPEDRPGVLTDSGQIKQMPNLEACKEEPREKAHPSGGGETILVAEDDELVRHFLEKALLRAGYRVIAASDGEEAIAAFGVHKDAIDLVISDMVMPRKTGKDLYDVISCLKPGIKIIFITGYSPDMIDLKGMPDGEVNFITKPFSKNDLLLRIRELLDGRREQ